LIGGGSSASVTEATAATSTLKQNPVLIDCLLQQIWASDNCFAILLFGQ
jgi:hypothetical protein